MFVGAQSAVLRLLRGATAGFETSRLRFSGLAVSHCQTQQVARILREGLRSEGLQSHPLAQTHSQLRGKISLVLR